MTNVQVLQVNLYDKPIGTLSLLDGDRSIFAFNESYLADRSRPTLSLSFKDSFGDLITETRPTQTSISPFFSNLLPEGHMRDYLAGRAGVKKMREFHLLMALGRDLPGAVTVGPLHDLTWAVDRKLRVKIDTARGYRRIDAQSCRRSSAVLLSRL